MANLPYDPFAPGQNGDYPSAPSPQKSSALKQILLKLGLNLAQGAGEGAFASLSPEAYQQTQISKRAKMALDAENERARQSRQQQWDLHNTPSAGDLLADAARREQMGAEADHRKTLENLQALTGMHSGAFSQAPVLPRAEREVGGLPQLDVLQSLGLNPPPDAANVMKVGDYKVTPNPYRPTPFTAPKGSLAEKFLGPGEIDLKQANPQIISTMLTQMGHQEELNAQKDLAKTRGASAIAYINSVVDPKDPLRPSYLFQLQDATSPKDVDEVVKNVRERFEKRADAKEQFAMENSPEAIAAAGRKSAAQAQGSEGVKRAFRQQDLERLLPSVYKDVASGAVPLNQALSNRGLDRAELSSYAEKNNLPLPVPLSGEAQKELSKTETIIHSLETLKEALKPLKDNNNPLYFTGDRLKYYAGLASPATDVISKGELDQVTSGVRILGGIRNYEALKKAQIHLPSFWHSSPQKSYEQVETLLRDSLYPARNNIYKFGAKSGVVQSGPEDPDAKLLEALRNMKPKGGK